MRGLSTIKLCLAGLAIAVSVLAVASAAGTAKHGAAPTKAGVAKPAAMSAMAATLGGPPPKPGCDYVPINVTQYGMKAFADAPVVRADAQGNLHVTLVIGYTDPARVSVGPCGVRLRVYNGALIGPTLDVKPGNTMYITVRNGLPPSGMPCPMPHSNTINSGMFNISNLHTHGLHVSPSGVSDNVFIEICPGVAQNYVIHIPADQPPGTYWYHSHVHGSTALQVSSGMEGALIVEGGIDNVPQIKAMAQKTFLLQQISYDTQGEIENNYDVFAPGWWATSKRSITVNGQIVPVITMRPGEIQHWRFIHGGVRETIPLAVQGGLPLYEVSTDGNALGRIDRWTTPVELDPGYRSDVLFQAPPLAQNQLVARYNLTAGSVQPANSLQFRKGGAAGNTIFRAFLATGEPAAPIAIIQVAGTPVSMQLPTNAELAPYAPFRPITDGQLNGAPQSVSFSIQTAICGPDPTKPCMPCTAKGSFDPVCTTKFMINMIPYSEANVRTLKLNTASQWHLEVNAASLAPVHPFHIHVNPFQMTRPGPDGMPEIVWKDTYLVHQGSPIDIRSRYTDFTGAFVLHCHILDHEDQGMMEKVEIVN
jgi:FtsP/CotA-like multicopper oxidase with cupredoxin domain